MKLYIANWKTYLNLNQEIALAKKFAYETNSANQVVICPSFVSLYPINEILKNSPIVLGAQNCAPITSGPLTGEVSAVSLSELDCKYCIIGHSERRQNFSESNDIILKKLELLSDQNITPILCIGESLIDHESNRILETLKYQLDIVEQVKKLKKLIIAYEPIWAIGTEVAAEPEYVEKIFSYIESLMLKTKSKISYTLVYGGSVNEHTAKELKKIGQLGGFLIGKASTDINKFLKIID